MSRPSWADVQDAESEAGDTPQADSVVEPDAPINAEIFAVVEEVDMPPPRKTGRNCNICKHTICKTFRACSDDECRRARRMCHANVQGDCEHYCVACFRKRCRMDWWWDGEGLVLCKCDPESREEMCHPHMFGGCRMGTEADCQRLAQCLIQEGPGRSEAYRAIVRQNLLTSVALEQISCRPREEQDTLKAQLRVLQKAFRRNVTRGGSVSHSYASAGLFLADAVYQVCRQSLNLSAHWQEVRPCVAVDAEKVLIVQLNPEPGNLVSDECAEHADVLRQALPRTADSPRVFCAGLDFTSEVLAGVNLVFVVGHRRSEDELRLVSKKILQVFSQTNPSLALVIFGICNSMHEGRLLADAGITCVCHDGEPQAEHVRAFDVLLRTELLKGPSESSLRSSNVLRSQVASAFHKACEECADLDRKPLLFFPSATGRSRHKLRRHRSAVTTLLLAAVVALILVKAWRIHITPRIYASSELKQCRAAQQISFSEVAGVTVDSLELDLTCRDPERSWLQDWFGNIPAARLRVDLYSNMLVQATYLLISHTVVSVGEALEIFEQTGRGCHYIITRCGYVVQQVPVESKAFIVKGCFNRSTPGNCSGLEANAHSIGVHFEGNGCTGNFTDLQYMAFEWLVLQLQRDGHRIPDEHILPITAADYLHGRHVAPGKHFDWLRLQKIFPQMKLHGSWLGAPIEARREWLKSVHAHHDAIGSEKLDFRSKWKGLAGDEQLSSCLVDGAAC